MVGLMGGAAIVVGMRPSVAITAAELGFGLESVETARSTDHALSMLGISVEATDDNTSEPNDGVTGPSGPASSPGGRQ